MREVLFPSFLMVKVGGKLAAHDSMYFRVFLDTSSLYFSTSTTCNSILLVVLVLIPVLVLV